MDAIITSEQTASTVTGMEDSRFHLLLDVLKILERNDNPEVAQSALEIIDSFDERLNNEQKAAVLKKFLQIKKKGKNKDQEEARRKHLAIAEEKERMREFNSDRSYL